MDLPELYKQQLHDMEQFKAVRDQAWAILQKEHKEITAAFGSKENLPEDSRKRMDEQIENYHKEWAMDTGERHQAILAQHEEERTKMGVKPSKAPAKPDNETKNTANNDHLTDKQIQLQKIIKQQEAIRKRNQEKKRHR